MGSETKRKFTFDAENESTMFGLTSGERYYADGSVVSALRDGIELGFEYARLEMTESFKPVYPFFTVDGRPAEDVTV